jgi:hypothetical protein
MISALSRRQHLVELADRNDREAERLCAEGKYADVASFKKLAAAYKEMAAEEATEPETTV